MLYCNKCGAELTGDSLFCSKCGSKITPRVNLNVPSTEETSPAAPLSVEGSIALAEKLYEKYKEIETDKAKIAKYEEIIRRPIPAVKSHSAFKYFLPWLITAPVISSFIFWFGMRLVVVEGTVGSLYVIFFISAVAFAATLAIGGGLARNIRNDMNYLEIARHRELHGKMDELKKKTASLRSRCSSLQSSVKEYEAIVPATHRSSEMMLEVMTLLESGKADSFNDALRL